MCDWANGRNVNQLPVSSFQFPAQSSPGHLCLSSFHPPPALLLPALTVEYTLCVPQSVSQPASQSVVTTTIIPLILQTKTRPAARHLFHAFACPRPSSLENGAPYMGNLATSVIAPLHHPVFCHLQDPSLPSIHSPELSLWHPWTFKPNNS